MVVLILTACPVGLRGHVSRWLLEISPGVFVGKPSQRVRERLWDQVLEYVRDGKALMVYQQRNEQGLGFLVHRHDWATVDFDGLQLIQRPSEAAPRGSSSRVSSARGRRLRK